MGNKKKYIVLISIILVYIIAMFFFFGKDLIKNTSNQLFLMASPSTKWKYSAGEWGNALDITEYSMKDFSVYVDNEYFGKYNLIYNDKFYLFDEQKQSHKFTGDMIAFRGNIPVDVIKFSTVEVTLEDKPMIESVLIENKIDTPYEQVRKWKTEIDLDNNGNKETIYEIDNVFQENPGTYSFGIIFIVEKDKIAYLYKNIETHGYTYSNCLPYIKNIIDINKDKKYEMMMACESYGNTETCNTLYDNKSKKYQILKKC